MSVYSLNRVSIAYGSKPVVCEVTFNVDAGDFFCIIGPNGSGKSSLIKGILGLLPLCNGEIKRGLEACQVAYVPQTETAERNFPATVMEVVLTGTQRKGWSVPFYTRIDRSAAGRAMQQFGIDGLAHRQVGELSGGQQQRMLLARAMCRNPEVLILDEPCTGLDVQAKEAFYAILRTLNREQGVTILMVSHDLDEVECCSSRVAVLNHKLIFCGSTQEWKDRNVVLGAVVPEQLV